MAVLSRWSDLADLSKSLAESEQSERTLRLLYDQLQKLEQQIGAKLAKGDNEQMSLRLQQSSALMSRVAKRPNSGVDWQLQPTQSVVQKITRQLPDSIDLLSERPHNEKIQIMMGRSGKHLTLDLPAHASAKQNLNQLKQAFANLNINVDVERDGRVSFSTAKSDSWALKEPWVMAGTGVRIAAGNPVSVALNEPAHVIEKLENLARENTSLSMSRDEIRQLQRKVKASLQIINNQRQQLKAELARVQQRMEGSQEMQQLSQSISQNMKSSEQYSSAVIVSTVNTTRNLISFGLDTPTS